MEEQDKPRLNLRWDKWFRLTDVLRVTLDSTLPAGAEPKFLEGIEVPSDEELEKKENRMLLRARKFESKISPEMAARLGLKSVIEENYDRYSHPISSFGEGKVVYMVHVIKADRGDKFPYLRLQLWQRGVGKKTHSFLKCGRAKELKPEHQDKVFGFQSKRHYSETEIKKAQYLPLSYPGLVGAFEPLFIRVAEHDNRMPYFLKITAHDGPDNTVIVEAKEVDSNEVPLFLRRG
ncbi:MAG: hypothetical protein UX81_C0007G0012 [Parcubacteria group bacterium GW2011_GWA2_47_12]|nr:MAG: hypothetical protein UX81_C0007G0012 [Parcubacteria group bacterium GW2011_GWA2_47_12]